MRRPGAEVPADGERGQSLVEFVLVLPLLLVLVFGIIEFANAWRTSQIVTNTTREVVRMTVVFDPVPMITQASATDTARARLTASGLDGSKATVTFPRWCAGSACTGDPDEVKIQYPFTFRFFGPVLDLLCGSGCGARYGTITLTSTAVMRNE